MVTEKSSNFRELFDKDFSKLIHGMDCWNQKCMELVLTKVIWIVGEFTVRPTCNAFRQHFHFQTGNLFNSSRVGRHPVTVDEWRNFFKITLQQVDRPQPPPASSPDLTTMMELLKQLLRWEREQVTVISSPSRYTVKCAAESTSCCNQNISFWTHRLATSC